MVIQKCKTWKIAWHYLCQERIKTHFVHTIGFGQKICSGPKQWKPEKNIKIVVSEEIAQNQKWHSFLQKVFWHVRKVGFTNCVFWKAVLFWKLYFYSVFSKTQQLQEKAVCWKDRNFMKTSGLSLNMPKRFFVCLFSGFNVIFVCLLCIWQSCKSVKSVCFFPSLGGFVGWLILVYLGLEGLVFCGSCFCFLWFTFCFCSVLLCFCFVVGLFLVLLLFCFCFFPSFFGEGLRVRWGGPKGYLTWP